MLYVITGTSGAGKTTLVGNLQTLLPYARVHDFDEGGVPPRATAEWRREQTEYWMQQARTHDGLFVLCGVVVPQEVIASASYPGNAQFGFLKIPPRIVKERLAGRSWSAQRIEQNVNWNRVLEEKVLEIEGTLFDATEAEDTVAKYVAEWILG